jgi:hypothetical protein
MPRLNVEVHEYFILITVFDDGFLFYIFRYVFHEPKNCRTLIV